MSAKNRLLKMFLTWRVTLQYKELLLCILGSAELGLLATVGAVEVLVFRRPIVGILSTGNELQDPNMEAALETGSGKIRDSNKTTLMSLIGVTVQKCNRLHLVSRGMILL